MYGSSKSLEGAGVEQLGIPMGDLTAEGRALGRRDWLTCRGGLGFGALSPVDRGLPSGQQGGDVSELMYSCMSGTHGCVCALVEEPAPDYSFRKGPVHRHPLGEAAQL